MRKENAVEKHFESDAFKIKGMPQAASNFNQID